jgi:hypothetical protein
MHQSLTKHQTEQPQYVAGETRKEFYKKKYLKYKNKLTEERAFKNK